MQVAFIGLHELGLMAVGAVIFAAAMLVLSRAGRGT